MIKLVIGDGTPLTSAAIPVRWCVDIDTLEYLRSVGAFAPHVLICTYSINGTTMYEDRTLVPLDRMMTYVNVHRAGHTRVIAFLVYASNCSNKHEATRCLRNDLLDRTKSRYYYHIGQLASDTTSDNTYHLLPDSFELSEGLDTRLGGRVVFVNPYDSEVMNVDIPKELFASYPTWLINLVNVWQSNDLEDACSFRRRLIFFVLFKMWFVLAYVIINYLLSIVVTLAGWLTGLHPLDYRVFRHPLTYSAKDIWQNANKCFFISDRTYVNYMVFISFCPMYLLIMNWLEYIAVYDRAPLSSISVPLMVFQNTVIAMLTPWFLLLCSTLYHGIPITKLDSFVSEWSYNPDNWIMKCLEKVCSWLIPDEDTIIQTYYNHLEEQDAMFVCEFNKELKANVSEIPVKQRSIKLVAQTIKHAVCKPLQRT